MKMRKGDEDVVLQELTPSCLRVLACLQSCAIWLFLGLMLVWLSACASGQRVVDHGFSFDVRSSSPEVEVLDYRYGDSIAPGARPQDYSLREGKVPQQVSITGAFPLEDTLYVKWRIKTTGEVYEDTVDLKSRLPSDIRGQDIHFIIEGSQLYVYLISLLPVRDYLTKKEYEKVKLDAVTPRQKRLAIYARHKITTVYPDQSNTQEYK